MTVSYIINGTKIIVLLIAAAKQVDGYRREDDQIRSH
jgi:hypothetical protein